jgi:hypothetical protein
MRYQVAVKPVDVWLFISDYVGMFSWQDIPALREPSWVTDRSQRASVMTCAASAHGCLQYALHASCVRHSSPRCLPSPGEVANHERGSYR